MRFSTITAIALPLMQLVNGQQGACSRILVRPEIRDMTNDQRNAWINAIRTLYLAKLPDGYNSFIDWFAYVHIQEYGNVHSDPKFLPWHRYFLYILQELVHRVDESVTIPYWDWSKDSQAAQDSIVLSDQFAGGNGNGGRGWELTSGPFANLDINWPTPHKLKRCYHRTENGRLVPAPTLDALPGTALMSSIVNQYTSFSDFAWNLELYHGLFHVLIGGNEGELGPPHSPNDLLFFLHHGNIDRYWKEWQTRHPDQAHSYEGRNYDPPKSGNANDMMSFAGTLDQIAVNTMFDTEAYPLCYTYATNNRQMLSSDTPQSKTFVNGTDLKPTTITFDKIDELSEKVKGGKDAQNSAGSSDSPVSNAPGSSNTDKSLQITNEPQIRNISTVAIREMAKIMNMKDYNIDKAVNTVNENNKKMTFLSSLNGFNKDVKK
jgi:tyrosinase